MTRHVIELNGQQYDALTGTPLSGPVQKSNSKNTSKFSSKSAPKHLDGFSRRHTAPAHSTTVSHQVHSKPARSQTLMRKAVKKPVPTPKIHATAVAPSATTSQRVAHTPTMESLKPGRAIRAHNTQKSTLISKFGKTAPTIKAAVLPVKPVPAKAAATTHAKTSASHPSAPEPHSALAHTAGHGTVKHDPFKSAIDNAVSHKQPKLRKKRMHHRIAKRLHVSPRFVSFSGAVFAVLVVGGVLAYQNMPELAMRVASARAGLNASLPAYQPAGFALSGPIKYDHGEVKINYKSNTDERIFDVTQKNSSWNSETLLENFVASTNQPYQTFQANGRTIYIYDGNKATWVDGGVWFNIDGKTNLNSDQLLRIADSL